MAGDANRGTERFRATPDGSGRNPREYGVGVSNIVVRTGASYPEASRMMEAVVERENMLVGNLRML